VTAQLPLALTLAGAPRLEDFVAGPNADVLAALQRALLPGGERQIYLSGPPGSGRSHLLMGQCAAAEARGWRCAYLPLRDRAALAPALLDGLEALDLVAIDDIDATAGDATWEAALFDLYNRCRDRATALLSALAARRAMQLPADVASFLLERTPRNPAAMVDTIARLDRASLAAQRRLTVPFVKQSLGL
jgi:DnaA family protein